MPFKSLKSKLLIAVSALVIGSGLLISFLVTNRYSNGLLEAMTAQAESLGHAVALEAADKVLINDLVALQKLFDHQIRSNPAIAYLLISRGDQVLAHTFEKGVPIDLLEANNVTSGDQPRFQKITATSGEHYLDIAWPILAGKAGVLRLGFSEMHYRGQMTRLWVQMAALTIAILLLALTGTLVFVRRVTSPLTALARATEKIDQGELGVRVPVKGKDEVAQLSTSFNEMVAHMEEYTHRLEEQAMELERAHHLTRTSCGILREIGSLRSLDEIGSLLVKRSQDILKCDHMILLVFNTNRDLLFPLSPHGNKVIRKQKIIQTAIASLGGLTEVTFINSKKAALKPPLVPKHFHSAARQAIIPLDHDKQLFGAMIIACPATCQCDGNEIELVGLILSQAAGVIKRAVVQEEETFALKSRIESTAEFSGIIGKDSKMQVIYKLIEDIAPTDATALIQGESGTGKELIARAIHQRSVRKTKPFVVINCSAYPATLLESELFGHEKGAFTGAIRQKSGRFEQADGGTVFLDEIGEIAPSAQIKLLRVLQTQKFERLGGEKTLSVDVRIIAATNKDLVQEVKNGNFREDLFYRLNVIPVNLPLLKNRRNDITLLAKYFLRVFATEQHKDTQEFSSEAMRLLLDHSWPGNVRELENTIEHAVVLAKNNRIEASDLPSVLRKTNSSAPPGTHTTIVENEKTLLRDVLEECGWNKKLTAQRLGISRSTLYGKLKRHQINGPTVH